MKYNNLKNFVYKKHSFLVKIINILFIFLILFIPVSFACEDIDYLVS